MKARAAALILAALLIPACEDTSGPADDCDTSALPLTGAAAAPTVIDVALEVQPGAVVALATATDPQGTENLLTVTQSIAVFPNNACNGTPVVVTDDLAGSGLEESFGNVAASGTPLYNAINAAAEWPVEVEFADADGNRTEGRVMARVVR